MVKSQKQRPRVFGPMTKKQAAKAAKNKARKPVASRSSSSNVVVNPRVKTVRTANGVMSNSASKKRTHHQLVCALTDPFCQHSVGARIPDGSTAMTLPYRSVVYVTATTSAQSAFTMLFAPDKRDTCYIIGGAGGSANTYLYGTTLVGGPTAATFFGAYVGESRLVSAGVRWIPSFPSTSAAPQIYVTELNTPSCMLNGAAALTAPDFEYGSNKRLMDGRQEWAFVTKRQDKNADNFDTVAATASTSSYSGCNIELTASAASTTYGVFEIILNWEITIGNTLKANSVVQALATRPPPENKLVLASVNKAASSVDTVIQGGVAQVSAHLADSAMAAIDDALAAGLAWLGI